MGAWLIVALVATLAGGVQQAGATSANLVISQVYGAGGNSGSNFTHDYIELFNRGSGSVSLGGLSLQYASATGTGNFGSASNLITELPAVSLDAGHYFLVREASNISPEPASNVPGDFADPTPVNMAAGSGKVALVSGTTSLGCNGGTTPCPAASLARVIDLIGYGGANFFEGTGPAPFPTSTTADFRANGGCTDTDNNAADFAVATASPRNGSTATNACGTPAATDPSGTGAAVPNVVAAGGAVTLTVGVTPGTNPTSTGLAVTADLTTIGGSATQQLFDDGTNGDSAAGDNTFTFATTVAAATGEGTKTLPFAIHDAQGRSGSGVILLGVTPTSDAAPAVTSRSPAAGATGVAVDANVTIGFTEPVDVAAGWYTIACGTSGGHTAAVSGGPQSFTLDPGTPFAPAETCTVTVVAANVTDQDTVDPPDTMAADDSWSFTTAAAPIAIHDIQGAAHTSPRAGQTVTNVNGIVTAKRANGYYMQDPNPDADDATSEGIFVFTSSAPSTVSVGDAVRVTARVQEFRPGGSTSANLTTTELTSPTTTVLSSGNQLPAATVVGSGGHIPPNTVIEDDATGNVETSGVFDPSQDGLDFYESLEGMRVQLNNAVAVGPTNSFGETPVVADNGANAGVRTARGGLLLRPDDGNPERLVADDALVAMPSLNVGDGYSGPLVGVMDYNFGNFFVEVTDAVTRVDNGLQRETTAPAGSSELAVATFNFENLDANDPQAKFDQLAGYIVGNLRSPDLIGGEEVQDNNGAVDDGTVAADQTLAKLVAAIQAAGGPVYDWRQINPQNDTDGGEPGGNIRQVILFRPDRGLAFVDRPGGTATTANAVIGSGGTTQLAYSPGRIDPTNSAFATSRKPLAAELSFRGHKLFAVVNHFNSKGGDQPLSGRFQPPTRSSEVQRHQQAAIVASFVSQLTAADPNAGVVVLGDLNDFEFSETVGILKNAGLHDLIETLPLNQRYSYEFEGNAQVLDHILVGDALFAQPLVLDAVHVNAEFADQASDHDPSVARITLDSPPTAEAGGPYAVDEGRSVLLAASGSDPEGGAVTYAWDLDNDGTFETPGQVVPYLGADGPATRTVAVRVTDPGGLSAVDAATVTIANLAPTITGLVASPTNGLVGEPVTFTGTASDPSSVDTAAGFTWAFDSGSGFGAFGSNGFAVTYATCGSYTVTAKARDKDGGISDPFTSPAVHVYDAALLPPLTSGAFNLVQRGRTVPIKITVGCNGFLGGLQPAISLRAGDYDPSVDPADPSYDVPPSSSGADTSGVMREEDRSYAYNLAVPSTATSGQLYTVLIRPFGGSAPTLFAVLKVK